MSEDAGIEVTAVLYDIRDTLAEQSARLASIEAAMGRIERRVGAVGDAQALRQAVAAESAERRAAIERGAAYLRKKEKRAC
jgi:hypothetical protein